MHLSKNMVIAGIVMAVSGLFFLLILIGLAVGKNPPVASAGDFPAGYTPPTLVHSSGSGDGVVTTASLAGLKVEALAGNELISTVDGKLYLQLNLAAGNLPAHLITRRSPLDLAVVIDKSGSMSGEKLEYVKEAVLGLDKFLTERDRVTVVVYDTSVDVIYKGSYEKRKFESAVSSVNSGSSTNLAGGLKEGIDSILTRGDRQKLVILLSDGLANIGESSPEGLASMVKREAAGITVSTVGVGLDYDENIMTSVAKAGRGNYYFMESPDQAQSIFEQELERATKIVIEGMNIEIKPMSGFSGIRGIGYELTQFAPIKFQPLDLYEGRESSFLFELEFDQLSEAEEVRAVEVEVSYKSRISGKTERLIVPIKMGVTSAEINPLGADSVYQEYMSNYYAQRLWEMDQKLNSGENDAAKVILDGLLQDMNSANTRLSGEFDSEVQSIKDKQNFVENLGDRDVNYSPEGRSFKKSNQNDSFQKLYNK